MRKLYKIIKQNRATRIMWLYTRCIWRFGFFRGNRIFKQISRRVTESYIYITLPDYKDRILIRTNTSDVKVFEDVFISLRFNRIHKDLEPKLIIDAGANIGLVTLFFANKYPNSIIYAIEPESGNYRLLIENTRMYKNVIPIQAAIWKNNSSLYFESVDDEKWAFRVTDRIETSQFPIRAITVDDILRMAKTDTIDIFKIDIEGSEKDIFEENYETWINNVKLIIIELHEGLRRGAKNSFYSAISHLKYDEYHQKGENYLIWFK